MDAHRDFNPEFEEIIERVYFESQFVDIMETLVENEPKIWFVLSPEESKQYLEGLLNRIKEEEHSLEDFLESPEASRIYRRLETGKNILSAEFKESPEESANLNAEINAALNIAEKIKWISQREKAETILKEIERKIVTQIVITTDADFSYKK